jgi:uncharacterized membrane protein (TIGR02234 family)
MRNRVGFAAALLLDLLGGGAALLVSARAWQTVRVPRERPLADEVLHVSGRTLDAAPTALALVALAGVVAVLATRGTARRVVGGVLVVTGALLVWRAVVDLAAMGVHRALDLVRSHHPAAGIDSAATAHVSVAAAWAVLTVIAGALVLASGAWVAAAGHTWWSMSARYDAPSPRPAPQDAADARARADATLWKALDAGDDPTAGN